MGNSTYQVKGKGGKLKNRFLRPRKVQGNWGETEKYIFKAKKSAGKIQGICSEARGKHKNTFSRRRKVQGN